MEVKKNHTHPATRQSIVPGGLPVRTDLRAGLSIEEIQQQLSDLWNQLPNSVASAFSNLTGGSSSTTAA